MANELQTKLDAILLDKNTNLLPENLKTGVNCLGVNGALNNVDTSDATAVSEDIYKNKTAYVNGEKVIGTMEGMDNQQYWRASKVTIESGWSDLNSNRVVLTSKPPYGKTLRWHSSTELCLHAGWVDIANAIGLTADKIKAGETILGVTGTYEGEKVVEEIDWTTEITNFGISDIVALSTTTPDIKTRLTFTDSADTGDTTTLPELNEHIVDLVLAKITSGANWKYCAYLIFDANIDLTQIKTNIALDTTGISCSSPAYPDEFKTSTSGYKYVYTFHSPNSDDGYATFKSLIEDGTTMFNISLTDTF